MLAGVHGGCTNAAGKSSVATNTFMASQSAHTVTPNLANSGKAIITPMGLPETNLDLDAPMEFFLQFPPAQGWEIHAAQERLLELGYSEAGWADGIFTEQMDAATRHFQYINGLPVDEILDDLVYEAIFSTEAIPYWPPRPFPGSDFLNGEGSGLEEVQLLQERLVELDYLAEEELDPGKIDMDDRIQQAIVNFQRTEGLTDDGEMSLRTWNRLFSPLAQAREDGDQLNSSAVGSWSTSIYTLGIHPAALAHDGRYIWSLGPHWENPHWTVLSRIDPQAGPLEAVVEVSPAPAEKPVRPEAGMLAAGGRLWMLVAGEWEGLPKLIGIQTETGEVANFYEVGECPGGFCFPSAALGSDGKLVMGQRRGPGLGC